MKDEEYINDYRVMQSCEIGTKRFVLCENTENGAYAVGNYETAFDGMLIRIGEIEEDTDYLSVFGQYLERQQKEYDRLLREREKRQSDDIPYRYDSCISGSEREDYRDKVMVLAPESLKPEFRVKEEQLMLVSGGNGAKAGGYGTKVFCVNLWSGERQTFRRADFWGELKPNLMPQWAKESLDALRQKPKERGTER